MVISFLWGAICPKSVLPVTWISTQVTIAFDISDNMIDEVADDIAVVISHNTQIEVLDVSGNNLQGMGAATKNNIFVHLKHCLSVITIILEQMKLQILFQVANPCLQELAT